MKKIDAKILKTGIFSSLNKLERKPLVEKRRPVGSYCD
jgi:hypothetical protein